MNTSSLSFSLSWLLAAQALAQSGVTFAAATKSPVAVRADIAAQIGFLGVAASTPLTTSNLLAPLSVASSGKSGSIGTVHVCSPTTGVTLVWDASTRGDAVDGVGTSASAQSSGSSFGAQSFLVQLHAGSAGASGYLRVSWQTVIAGTAIAKAALDVGDNTVEEWTGTPTLNNAMVTSYVPVVVPASGLVVRLTVEGKCNGTGISGLASRSYGALRVAFQDGNGGKASITPYGTDCGPTFTAGVVTAGGQHVFTFVLANGFPSSFALHAIGSQSLDLDLGNGCKLLSNAVVVTVLPTDALGSAVDILRVPITTAATTYHQALPLGVVSGNLVLKSTGGTKLVSTGL